MDIEKSTIDLGKAVDRVLRALRNPDPEVGIVVIAAIKPDGTVASSGSILEEVIDNPPTT